MLKSKSDLSYFFFISQSEWLITKWSLVPVVSISLVLESSCAVIKFLSGTSNHPHVLTNLYTIPNTRTLTSINTIAVTTFAKAFNPLSECCWGCLVGTFCFNASPRANAGKARLWVKVNLWRESENEYGPTEPLAAARKSAYSKSKASKTLYLFSVKDILVNNDKN